ncbi:MULTISPECIES: hypothetical protein [Paenibacillus]|uniref:Uncharacterized protein n=2 Tax=Paenibacillus TaxID=44249 RepID=A0A7Y6BU99_9BACL|nr:MULTISPECIES: hypothetical protein [Paenibacillus]KGP78378.1 hypothetical protein P363_0132175 [Paenibacillus sp. MAEPY1]KGP78447.1 hypothetical protein P364_0128860 [Paenibacillus sp. MAEPY2]MDN4603992.1 hypothetical protein [Paenibacillus vandeheii]NUU74688.1 hypothetical protein [Paenibacillus xylanilyticus]
MEKNYDINFRCTEGAFSQYIIQIFRLQEDIKSLIQPLLSGNNFGVIRESTGLTEISREDDGLNVAFEANREFDAIRESLKGHDAIRETFKGFDAIRETIVYPTR